MTERAAPKLAKWPFLLGDFFLLSVGTWIVFRSEPPIGLWSGVICLAAVALGAWVCIIPFLREHAAALKLAEAGNLAETVAQIRNLEVIQSHITDATGLWTAVQNQAERTAQSSREVSDRVAAQLQEFSAFFQKTNDAEKNTLRLEVDKLKRAEAEWLQVLVRILDFVFALHQAGVRTGQPELIRELTQFQSACRDAARRIGLTPFAPSVNDPFDPRLHQTPDPQAKPGPDARVAETSAPGFTFQTQLLRRALVRLASASNGSSDGVGQTMVGVSAQSPAEMPASSRRAGSVPDQQTEISL